MSKYKKDIIRLRKEGKTYNEIKEELDCSKGTISYHCKQEGLEDIGKKQKEISEEEQEKIREYYKNYTKEQTADRFDVSESTVQKYGDKKKKVRKVKENSGPTQHKKDKGDLTELKVATRLVELGHTVLEPYGENDRYDIVFEDENENFQRVQCKTPKSKNGERLQIRTCSVSGGKTYTYHGQVDYFATYSKETGECYLVPFEEVENCHHSFHLRIELPKNGQECRMAKDFVL